MTNEQRFCAEQGLCLHCGTPEGSQRPQAANGLDTRARWSVAADRAPRPPSPLPSTNRSEQSPAARPGRAKQAAQRGLLTGRKPSYAGKTHDWPLDDGASRTASCPPSRGLIPPKGQNVLISVSGTLGLSTSALQQQLQSGTSVSQIAQAEGVSQQTLVQSISSGRVEVETAAGSWSCQRVRRGRRTLWAAGQTRPGR